MQGITERWLDLCQEASVEEDPAKLLDLITEINRLLTLREARKGKGPILDAA